MMTYDVIVVGAGSVGNPTAMALARKRAGRILVIDRRSAPGQGDNKAAIGGVRATHSIPAKILLGIESLEIFSTWKERTGEDIGFKPGGYAFPVYTEEVEASLKALLPIQHRYDLDISWLGPEDMAQVIPGLATEGLLGGTYSPGDGQVSPLLASVAFSREAMRLGVTYHLRERVVGFTRAGDRVTGVVTDKGTYHAGEVVIAAGADAADLGPALGIDIPVFPESHEAGISAPVARFLGPLVVDLRAGPEGKTANFYFGQNTEGQVIFCYTPSTPFHGTDRGSTGEFLPVVASRLVGLIPRLEGLLVRRVWRGCYPMTADGAPIVDRVPGLDGLVLAVGMCGQGLMLGPGVGQEVASLVVDDRSTLPEDARLSLRYDRDHTRVSEALK